MIEGPAISDSGARDTSGRTRFTDALAILLTVGAIAWALDLHLKAGVILYTEQVLSGILAIVLPVIFLSIRGFAGQTRLPWYDVAAALLSFGAAGYMAARYPVLAEMISDTPADGLIAGTLTMLLLIEGLRRTVGKVMTVLVVCFFAIALVGHHLPGQLSGRPIGIESLLYYLSWDPTGVLGTPLTIVASIVTAFVFFGQVLLRSGGSEFFTEISTILVGRFRGGQAKIAVTASGLFGSISGSAVSNVVTTGVVTIPLMRNAGYRPVHAGAIEAVASTGGQLMPPIMGAAAFVMAEFLDIPYTDVVLAALIPAILYYAALFVAADLEAAKSGIKPVAKEDIPALGPVLKHGWHFPIPFAVLIVALFTFNRSPQEAAIYAVVAMIATGTIIGYQGRRLTLGNLVDALRDTGYAVLDIIMIGAAAGIVIGVIGVTGIGFGLTLILVELGGTNFPLLMILAAGICILLGMGMPTVGVYLVLAPLIGPSLVDVGIEPIAAHLFILYFGMMSMITPPVAIAAFAAATLTGEDAMKTGFWAMRFGWFAYVVPFLFILAPGLLMKGGWVEVLYVTVLAFAGIWFISIGIVGHFATRLGPVMRIAMAVTGIAVLVPARAFEGSLWVDLAGLAAGVALVARQVTVARRASVPA